MFISSPLTRKRQFKRVSGRHISRNALIMQNLGVLDNHCDCIKRFSLMLISIRPQRCCPPRRIRCGELSSYFWPYACPLIERPAFLGLIILICDKHYSRLLRSESDRTWCARTGNDITDIHHACHILHKPFESEAEPRVRC